MSRPGLMRAGSSIAASNKTIVLVSGGNSGIGYEIVKSLASQRSDYQILLGCRDTTKGEMAVATMGAPLNVNPIQLDITDDRSIEHCVKAIEQVFGRLDVLINNAGTAGKDLVGTELEPTRRQVWQYVYNLNVISTAVFTERVIPLLEQSKNPRIIFVSAEIASIGKVLESKKPNESQLVPFCTSKAAVNMMAVDYAMRYPRFKVNASCPGHRATPSNDTEMSDDTDPARGAVNVFRLATQVNGPSATFTNSEGTIPW
ncbi:hypothetical protein OHC33_000960 [Knufia fluminis]|uniref:Uncharacterized protein n=1 Tax=Knufia fluminis TaxID=191047 RepID=A0AAN8IBX7_9EURO|nr:hypothetical protein OHC33_000960 [Knufia fluminis]